MRPNINKYVRALYEVLIKEKNENNTDNVISNFVRLLARNKLLSYNAKIISEFNQLYNKENGIVELQVITKKDIDIDDLNKISDFYKDFSKAKALKITNVVQENMTGGIILKTADQMLDLSINKRISDMRKHLSFSITR